MSARIRPEAEAAEAAPRRSHRYGYLLLLAGLAAIYAVTLAPGATFSDGPEITVAIHTLGVIHPTGYPLFTLVGHAFVNLLAVPLPVIVRVEILNALCGIGSAWFVARSTRSLLVRFEPPERRLDTRRADLAALMVGWFIGASPLLWAQVRIPEVYAFQMFLVCAAGWAWLRFELTDKNGYVVLAALPMGMGLANHVTMIYMLPAAFLYLLVRKPLFFVTWLLAPVVGSVRLVRKRFWSRLQLRGWWAFPAACVVGFAPICSYYYLIWANAHTTGVTWGDVHDWESLYHHATGRQYHGFMELKELSRYWKRLGALPVIFDKQFLPAGTALFFTGIVSAFRRRWRFATFLMAYLLFNVGHGVYYAVGDYGNYLIPALLSCAMFIGVGLWWVLGWTRTIRATARLWVWCLTAGSMLAVAAVSALFYAKRTKRYPAELAQAIPLWVALPLGILAAVALVAGIVVWWRGTQLRRPLRPSALPRLALGALMITLLCATAIRGRQFFREVTVGESYGAEVAGLIPPGSVFMTQGDGFLFTMWYEHHVHDRGVDFVTLDMGNLRTPWYQRYLYGHYPPECDPLRSEFEKDRAAYQDKCGTFRQRMDLVAARKRKKNRTYISMGLRRGTKRPKAVKVTLPIVRGADAQCADGAWRGEHPDECRCFNYGKEPGVVEEDCIHSAEEGGITPRWPIEVLAHRIIEDTIRERAVYERNMFTRWVGDAKKHNKRQWNGPAYQRLPGQYDLLNRGRYNQIIFHEDAAAVPDPCGHELARPVDLRPLRRVGTTRRRRYRETYEPNDRAVLVKASYLTAFPGGTDDHADREFAPGDTVYLKLHWFEQFKFDAGKDDKRGDKVREGVRACFFGPDGRRLSVGSTVSHESDRGLELVTTPTSSLGRYLVQACSVGEVGEDAGPLPADLPCRRIILEYPFELRAGGGE